MTEVLDRKPKLATIDQQMPQKKIRITLSVCDCYINDVLTLMTPQALEVARALGIARLDLEAAAVSAMITGRPQIVACYDDMDIAESKLAQLDSSTPFLSRPCHSFELQRDG